ncbi:MAG: class I SAM-dependent methyltransferase, partial [Propionibacteriaceae bacterium]
MNLLFTEQGATALKLAAHVDDPASLAAATLLRQHVSAELAAEALTQETLRRKATGKFGDLARELFFTRDGLEQASRRRVAQWRAARYLELGWTRVVDLGCGIGADARAFHDVGIQVTAVERDVATAEFARANLPQADVVTADATTFTIPDKAAVFLDPARRSAAGRTWDHRLLTPSWEFTLATLAAHQGCAKLGPGLDRSLLPSTALAEWVSDGGDVVECGLWSG